MGDEPTNLSSNGHPASPAREDPRGRDPGWEGAAGREQGGRQRPGPALGLPRSRHTPQPASPRSAACRLARVPFLSSRPSSSSFSSSRGSAAPAAGLSAPLPAPLPALAAFPAVRPPLLFLDGDGGWGKAVPPPPAARLVLGGGWGTLRLTSSSGSPGLLRQLRALVSIKLGFLSPLFPIPLLGCLRLSLCFPAGTRS